MDNSIRLLYEMVKKLQSDMEAYSSALRMHAITIPHETLEHAVQHGFPEDIYSYYMDKYYSVNVVAAEGVINYIKQQFVPYLENVSYDLYEAMSEDGDGIASAAVLSNPTAPSRPQGVPSSSFKENLAFRTQQLIMKSEAIDKNDRDMEKALGIKQGSRMSISEADMQNANPNYTYEFLPDSNGDYFRCSDGKIRNRKWWLLFPYLFQQTLVEWHTMPHYRKNPNHKPEYGINCATCALAYVLRLRGFDVTAKGNVKGTKNHDISKMGIGYFDIWKNPDGSKAEPMTTAQWAKKNGLSEMTHDAYKSYFEEVCKDKGVYILTVNWKEGGGHATILQRDEDGHLYHIEPQVYESHKTADGRRSIDGLISHLTLKPLDYRGIMRVDDKIFDTKYADLFNVNKK